MLLKTFTGIITFSIITTNMAQASTEIEAKDFSRTTIASTQTIYQSMSTEELQKKVERHSKNGDLSFTLGQELIKRWTHS